MLLPDERMLLVDGVVRTDDGVVLMLLLLDGRVVLLLRSNDLFVCRSEERDTEVRVPPLSRSLP